MSIYFEELKNIVESCRNRIAEIDTAIKNIRASKTYSAEYINTAVKGFEGDKEQVYASYVQKAKKAYTDYLDRLQKKVESLSGSSINTEDLVLLNSPYFELSQAEFDVLAKKHSENYTMTKALKKYAMEKGLSLPTAILSVEEKKAYAYDVLCNFISYFRCSDLTWAIANAGNTLGAEINSKLPE